MIWIVLRDFLLNDVLGNFTAAALFTAAAWSVRKVGAVCSARRNQNSAE
ncbi:hypothetical protein [Streptomyces sp. NPDC054849]